MMHQEMSLYVVSWNVSQIYHIPLHNIPRSMLMEPIHYVTQFQLQTTMSRFVGSL